MLGADYMRLLSVSDVHPNGLPWRSGSDEMYNFRHTKHRIMQRLVD